MRLRLSNAAAAVLLAMPGIACALGLGEIQLKSTLNAPLNAEIELTATDEELASLKAQLASRDTFTRYGLDYPSFLSGVQVQLVRRADGNSAIVLTSSAPITEPFATFLVEANWARGRIQREYTVLFDPPTFAQQQAPAAPVTAPSAGNNRGSEITRPPAAAPAPATAAPPPAVRPSPPAASSRPAQGPAAAPAAGGQYTVPRGDSLSSIARSRYGEATAEQAMIAIFRGNPQAFGGNINQLRAGSVLRLPDSTEVAAIDRDQAHGEVRRQMAQWSGHPAAAPATGAGSTPRLVLVPPASGNGAGSGAGGASNPAPATAQTTPDNRVQIGAPGLAGVQQNASKQAAPAATESKPAATPPPAEPAASAPAVQTQPAATPPAVEKPPPPKPAAKPAPPPATSEPSLLDRVLGQWWLVVAGLVLLLAVALGVRAARRRRASGGDTFAPFAVEPAIPEPRDTASDTFPLRRPADTRDPSIVVEENAVPRSTAARKETPRTVDLDETPASAPTVDATGTFEQGDPLAEADFHMAYGLYDQAADLVKLAIAREPARRDLKLKLLEVFFVWGNKEQFLQTARELARTRDAAQPGEWEKVIIMGKQLAPEDPLFTQSQGVSPSSVDLNLEGGQNLVDFDLPGDSSNRLPRLGDGTDTGIGATGLDFTLDDPDRGATDDSGGTLSTQQLILPTYAIDGPTVEQPALGVDDTLAGKLGARRAPLGGTDQTAELALDDLGLDLGKLEATGADLLDDSQLSRALESGEPEPPGETLVAGLEDTARQLLEQAGNAEVTELLPLADPGSGDTSRVSGLDLNFDIDSNASTGTRDAPDFSLDLDVGLPEPPVDTGYQRTQRIEPAVADADATQRDLEPVSMSEVGTKLDLARAYMDMGDPDGARSILGEVLTEGSAAQRQEAQRLLDSIPG